MDVTIALQRAVRGFALGSEALAAALGVSVTSLNHKVSPTYPAAHASPEELLSIMEITGDHGALHALASTLGYVCLRVPQAADAEDGSALALVASVREFGEFATEVSRDLLDGRVSDNELARIEREGAQAMAAIAALVALCGQINRAAKPQEQQQRGAGELRRAK